MTRTWSRVVMLVWVCIVLLGHAARAEEAQPLQPCVLVLPLQASPELSGDQVFLGLAVYTMRLQTAENTTPVMITILTHIATGALTFAASVILGIQIRRNVHPRTA